MNAGDAHKESVSANLCDCFNCRRADGYHGVFEKAAADQNDFDAGMLHEFHRDGWAVRYDGRSQIVAEMTRQFSRGGAAVQDHDLIVVNHSGCRPADCDLSAGGQLLASRKIDDGGRCGQGATVYALEESFMREFAEIAADGVFGEAKFVADVLGNDLTILFELF